MSKKRTADKQCYTCPYWHYEAESLSPSILFPQGLLLWDGMVCTAGVCVCEKGEEDL